MHRSIVFVTSSLSSLLHDLVNACYISSQLLLEMVSLSVLENIFCIEELLIDKTRIQITRAHHENFSRSKTRCFRLSCFYPFEKFLKHPHQRLEISRPEDFGHEITALTKERAS